MRCTELYGGGRFCQASLGSVLTTATDEADFPQQHYGGQTKGAETVVKFIWRFLLPLSPPSFWMPGPKPAA
jgi:hypothetical protein